MLPLLLLNAAAAQLMPPRPIDALGWIKEEDYPPAALRTAERGYFLAYVTTSSSGSPLYCEPVSASQFTRTACDIVMQRAHFDPALDRTGHATTGLHLHRVAFRIHAKSMPPAPKKYALALTVDRLPSGSPDPVDVRVALQVTADGQIVDCAPLPFSTDQIQNDEQLGATACLHVSNGYNPPIARDAQRRALASVQSVLVRFQTLGAAAK